MPSTLIEVRTDHAPDVETGIIDAVHDALIAAFAIPPIDKHVRLLVHAPHRFAVPGPNRRHEPPVDFIPAHEHRASAGNRAGTSNEGI